jgi:hypothetical protein
MNAAQPPWVVAATPSIDGRIDMLTADGLIDSAREFERCGWHFSWLRCAHESVIQIARNSLAAAFLAIGEEVDGHLVRPTHLLFIDADVGFGVDDVLRLLSHELPVVGGLYPQRRVAPPGQEHRKFDHAQLLDEQGRGVFDPDRGLVEIMCASAGFLLVERRVFMALIETGAAKKINWCASDPPAGCEQFCYDFFPSGLDEEGRLWAEDWGFSRLWRGVGGRLWADYTLRLPHVGQHVFSADPAQELYGGALLREPLPGDPRAAA